MNINTLFPSKFVAAGDLCGQEVVVTMASVKVEDVGTEGDRKPVLYFVGMTKGMVLNRINSKRISVLYGAEVEGWAGKSITLYPSETEYGGDTVPCIRVRQQAPAGVQLPQQVAPPVAPPIPEQPRITVAAGNGSGPRF